MNRPPSSATSQERETLPRILATIIPPHHTSIATCSPPVVLYDIPRLLEKIRIEIRDSIFLGSVSFARESLCRTNCNGHDK